MEIMKKLLSVFALIGFSYFVQAQTTQPAETAHPLQTATYKAFKVDFDLGYAIPSNGSGTKAGATFTIEPHYRLSDAFAIGFRFEGAGLGYEYNDGTNNKVKVSLLTSYCLSGDYYLTKSSFRAFVGGGAGLFTQKAIVGISGENASTSASNFGVFPRIGFEAGHFRMSAAYDIAGNNANYLAVTLGFFLGGGKK